MPPISPLHRTCTECGKHLETGNPKAKTCSSACRGKRSRREARERRRNATNPGAPHTAAGAALADILNPGRREITDVVKDVFREELRPVVREAITEETLRAIQGLVSITPRMVELIAQDMEDLDPQVRQRAYGLVAKYTLGHPAVVQPEQQDLRNQLTVVFDGMPRPARIDVDSDAIDAGTDAREHEANRRCNGCDLEKPATEFVGNSDRCHACHNELAARAEAILNPPVTT